MFTLPGIGCTVCSGIRCTVSPEWGVQFSPEYVIIGSDMEKQMVAITPLGRVGQPEDIAKVAVFLASDDAGWVTGERITVAGGLL